MNPKAILAFALGPVVSAVLGILIIPLIAWTFEPEDVGRLNIFQVTASFILLFSVLGLDQAYVREYHESGNKQRLLRACIYPGFLVLLVLVSFTLPFSNEFSYFLYGIESFWIYFLTVSAFLINYFIRFLSLILRMQERGLAYSMSEVLPRLFQLALIIFIALTAIKKNFLLLLGLTIISLVIVFIVFAWNTRDEWFKSLYERADGVEQRRIFKFGLPLIISSLIYWGVTASGSYALRSFSDFSELAIYSIAVSFSSAAAIFQAIFTTVWAPIVYKWAANNKDMRVIEDVGGQALAIISALLSFILAFSWLTEYLLPDHYLDVKYILLCCCLQPVLYTLSEITCVGIGISRRTGLSVWVSLAALLGGIISLILLVPELGARGAAIANAIAFLAFFIGRTELSAMAWRGFSRVKMHLTVFFWVVLSICLALQDGFHWINFVLLGAISLFMSVVFYIKQWKVLINHFFGLLGRGLDNDPAV